MDGMNNKNAMSDEKLEAAAGGYAEVGGCRFSGDVGRNGGVVGQWYYIEEKDNSNTWYYGRLSRTKDVEVGWFGCSHRIYYFDVAERSGEPFRWNRDFSSDNVTLYTAMERL